MSDHTDPPRLVQVAQLLAESLDGALSDAQRALARTIPPTTDPGLTAALASVHDALVRAEIIKPPRPQPGREFLSGAVASTLLAMEQQGQVTLDRDAQNPALSQIRLSTSSAAPDPDQLALVALIKCAELDAALLIALEGLPLTDMLSEPQMDRIRGEGLALHHVLEEYGLVL